MFIPPWCSAISLNRPCNQRTDPVGPPPQGSILQWVGHCVLRAVHRRPRRELSGKRRHPTKHPKRLYALAGSPTTCCAPLRLFAAICLDGVNQSPKPVAAKRLKLDQRVFGHRRGAIGASRIDFVVGWALVRRAVHRRPRRERRGKHRHPTKHPKRLYALAGSPTTCCAPLRLLAAIFLGRGGSIPKQFGREKAQT